MLIQNVTSNPVPAPVASYGNAGSPAVAVSVPPTGNTQVEPSQTATPVASKQDAQSVNVQLQGAVDKLNQAMQEANTGVEFSIDKDSKKPLIKVIDIKTGEMIKQFPSEEMIAISQSIDQFQKGLLLRQKA